MSTDAELLRRYVEDRSEAAFAELVHRHLNLVYAAALRRTSGRHVLAEEIVQKVFTDLARKSAQLTRHPTLTGWLHRSTRYAAIDAARVELRRQKLAETLSSMPEESLPAASSTDWNRLRPMIDAALDELNESDREIMLLRFFQGLTFSDVGARLNINENAARMRTERALERLRRLLSRRGFTSTAALAGLLTSESLVAAPAHLSLVVTTTAVAAPPAGLLATFFMNLLTNKIAAVSLSAAVGVIAATLASAKLDPTVPNAELTALRQDNLKLTQAVAPGANPAAAAAVADEISAQTTTIVAAIEKRLDQPRAPGSHRNHGQATPRDAVLTLWWAVDSGDIASVAKLIAYDEKDRETLRTLYAGMPEAIRARYHTPEELAAFFWVAGTLLQPMPSADVCEKATASTIATELGAGRVLLRQPGQTRGGIDVKQTPAGWTVVMGADQVAGRAERVLSNEMLAKLGLPGR